MKSRTLIALMLSFGMIYAPALAEEFDVNGAKLKAVIEGEGTPVVFVHGALSDSRVWEPYRDIISKKRKFVTYDQRYFGPADWPDKGEGYSTDGHVDDLIEVVQSLDAGPVHLVAWSYGGTVATRAAIKRQDLFKSIIHFEPANRSLFAEIEGGSAIEKDWIAAFDSTGAALQAGKTEDAALRMLEAVRGLPIGAAEELPAASQEMWRTNGRTIPRMFFAPIGEQATCDALAKVDVPTLIVDGSDSVLAFRVLAAKQAQCQPNALRLQMVGVDHGAPSTHVNEFSGIIENFISLFEN